MQTNNPRRQLLVTVCFKGPIFSKIPFTNVSYQ